MLILNLIKNFSIAIGTVTTVGFLTSAAHALTLTGTSGNWSNVIGGSSIELNKMVGAENQVLWGTPKSPNTEKSGLGFTGVGTSILTTDQVFQIGTLRHFNNTLIAGTAASQTDLNISLNFSDPSITKAFNFTFTIDETANIAPASSCPYPSIIPCSDKISFPNAFPTNSFNIAGINYTLELLGFSQTQGGTPINKFISEEGGTNTAYVYGKITAVIAKSVPEPDSVLSIVGFGILALGSMVKFKLGNLKGS